jgi:hypothetical protein
MNRETQLDEQGDAIRSCFNRESYLPGKAAANFLLVQ